MTPEWFEDLAQRLSEASQFAFFDDERSLCRDFQLTHTRLHQGTEYAAGCRGIPEVEAESVAYLVCASAGLSTDSYSFAYVARWSAGDVGLIRTTAERVISCARAICSDAGFVAKPAEGAPEADLEQRGVA